MSSDSFMPHGMCYLWHPGILALHIVSDSLIACAYVAISCALTYVVLRRRSLEYKWMLGCFAAFILACAGTHFMEVWVIWNPDYWLSGAVKALTAAASVTTAVLLIRLVPQALTLPSLQAMRGAYARLQIEVAERRRTETALRDAFEQLRQEAPRGRLAAIIESSDDAIVSTNLDGIITSWNRGAEKLFGYSAQEILGKPAAVLLPPECADEGEATRARMVRGEKTTQIETVRVGKDGRRIDVSITASPLRDSEGRIVGVAGIARDITEHRRNQNDAYEQSKTLDLAQVMVRDLDGRIVRWTRGAQNLYGYTASEALGKKSHELLDTRFPEPLELIEAALERKGEWHGDLLHRTRDGVWLTIASTWVLHRNVQGQVSRILECSTDVTERRKSERQLAAQLARHHLLNAITRAVADRQDLTSICQVVIGTLEEELPVDFACFCLYRPDRTLVIEQVGAKSRILAEELRMTNQAELPIEENGLSRCAEGRLVYEPDLQSTPCAFPQRLAASGLRAMVLAPLLIQGKMIAMMLVARKQPESFTSGECEFLRQLSEHVALAAHQAQLYGSLRVAYDDLRQTQQAVLRQEKFRVLGQMASGMAHDINNTLSPAALYVGFLLRTEIGQSSAARDQLIMIQRAIEGVAETVARMKEFYGHRDEQLVQKPVSLNRAAEQAIDLTRARWDTMPQESGVVIVSHLDLERELPIIRGDEGEIRDALTNLILNAVDAMPRGGQLTLRTRKLPANRVCLEVADTGIGMDEVTRSRCLELFFTTKGERGSGLGLAMVYGAVERRGGEIEIESEPGVGSTFRLIFPSAGKIEAPAVVERGLDLHQRPLRILVIDDDPAIVRALEVILRDAGHTVEMAEGGQRGIDAFRAARERGEPFDLVITDLGMPHMDGRTVAATVKAMQPDTYVVLLTGWGHRLLAANEQPPHVDRVIGKPPTIDAIRATLAQIQIRTTS